VLIASSTPDRLSAPASHAHWQLAGPDCDRRPVWHGSLSFTCFHATAMRHHQGCRMGNPDPHDVASEPKQGDPNDKIILLSFAKNHKSISSMSPFAGKLELMLRIAGLPYHGFKGDVTNKLHAPKHKVRRRVKHPPSSRATQVSLEVLRHLPDCLSKAHPRHGAWPKQPSHCSVHRTCSYQLFHILRSVCAGNK
jgi:hypothetical protein